MNGRQSGDVSCAMIIVRKDARKHGWLGETGPMRNGRNDTRVGSDEDGALVPVVFSCSFLRQKS